MYRTIPNTQLKKQEIAIISLEKIALKIEAIVRDKEGFVNDKRSFQVDIIKNVCVFNSSLKIHEAKIESIQGSNRCFHNDRF